MSFQVFISFKNSDAGQETLDKVKAEQLYKALTEKGVNVFFSNITLMELGKAAYKEAIDDALDECAVMVVIGSRKEYLTSEWVKYEWNSYQQNILSKIVKGTIITYLDKLPLNDVPLAIRHYQSFDFEQTSVDSVASFIISTIQKIAPMDTGMNEEHKSVPVIDEQQYIEENKNKHASAFDSGFRGEFRKQEIQCASLRKTDMPGINYVYERLPKRKLFVLDVGCGYGHVARDRFRDWEDVFVLGVDHNETVIEKARRLCEDDRYAYEVLNLEGETFKDDLYDLMEKYDIDQFDVIFGAYILQHMEDPVKFLRNIREFISNDGYVIFRNSDDGSMISNGDNGLIEKICQKHYTVPGASDRQVGRKLYYYLYTTGYKGIKSFGAFKDVSGLDYDERMEVFTERFSSRIMYFSIAHKKDPYNITIKNNYEWMKVALDQLQEIFGNESFWYGETIVCTVAKKK